MPIPRLHDDGSTVTLDLHGARVDEALRLSERLVRVAARRGRRTLKIVHGTSTSSTLYQNRTIKHALETALEDGSLKPYVASLWKNEGSLMLGLSTTAASDPTPIRISEIAG